MGWSEEETYRMDSTLTKYSRNGVIEWWYDAEPYDSLADALKAAERFAKDWAEEVMTKDYGHYRIMGAT
jgi:hypothetical protein